MDLNRATIIGRLTRDPEVRTTPTGKTVASMSLATNRTWVDQAGAKQERPEYHNCVLWGKLGEIAGQYLTKGRRAYVEGRIETRDWTGQDGVKRYRTEIIVESMIMLDGPRGASGAPSGATSATAAPASYEPPVPKDESNDIRVEDIPF